MKFGIIGDNLGVREDMPYIKLSTAFSTGESNMVTYHDGAIRRMKGSGLEFVDANGAQVPMPDGLTIIHWHYHKDPDGIEYIFAYTAEHVYKWGNYEWNLMFTGLACETWSSADFGKYVVSTNNLNLIQVWNEESPGDPFANLGGESGVLIQTGEPNLYLTKAAHVIVYESYIVFADTYEDGVRRKYRKRWCSRGDLTDFDETSEGDAGSNDLEASLQIMGMGIYSATGTSILITFTNKTINAVALVEDEIVFSSDDILSSTGCLAADSIINDPQGNVYYLANDWAIRRVFDDASLSVAIDKTIKGINKTLFDKIRSCYLSSLNQICWSIPRDAASTGNDKIVRLNLNTMGWEPAIDINVSSFGLYSRQSTPNIDDIDVIIDEYDVIIDSVENTEGLRYILIGDYDGLSYSLATAITDKGNSFSGSFVLATDLADKKALSEVKRTNGGWLWFEGEAVASYKATVEIRTQDQKYFEYAGSLNLYSERKLIEQFLPFDFRGKVFEIRISGVNPFAFCGMIFDFTYDGDE